MLNTRRFCLKWTSILIAYICIFLLCYEYGTSRRRAVNSEATPEPRHLVIKRLFYDHPEYLNSSMILLMIEREFQHRLSFDSDDSANQNSILHHALVVFYDYEHHHVYFQQFLWLYSSWIQLHENSQIKNDLIVFISSPTIPNDFRKLINLTEKFHHQNQLLIYPCQTLIDSVLDENYQFLQDLSPNLQMELTRLFYWQQTRLSSLLLFLHEEHREKLSNYDFIFRFDVDSFLMPKFSVYRQRTSLVLGQTIPHDRYTLNRLKRIGKYFHSPTNNPLLGQFMTISWFGKLDLLTQLTRQVLLMTVWLIKEEFTESERLHHLTYLNYPSWYIDGILEYATAIILAFHQYENNSLKQSSRFDCRHLLTNCLHVSLRDPTHHLHFSKHSLHLLAHINQSNVTENELYIYRTVIKSNGVFNLHFH